MLFACVAPNSSTFPVCSRTLVMPIALVLGLKGTVQLPEMAGSALTAAAADNSAADSRVAESCRGRPRFRSAGAYRGARRRALHPAAPPLRQIPHRRRGRHTRDPRPGLPRSVAAIDGVPTATDRHAARLSASRGDHRRVVRRETRRRRPAAPIHRSRLDPQRQQSAASQAAARTPCLSPTPWLAYPHPEPVCAGRANADRHSARQIRRVPPTRLVDGVRRPLLDHGDHRPRRRPTSTMSA